MSALHRTRLGCDRALRGAGESSPRLAARAVACVALLLSLIAGSAPRAAAAGLAAPTNLTVDDLKAPIGLGLGDVQFAWRVVDPRRGAIQSAYRIVVSSTGPNGPAVVWDTGKVLSPEQAFIPYGGLPLKPDSAYRWTVQTWSGDGDASRMAPPATFETGLADGDWRASWIQRPSDTAAVPDEYTYARKLFALDPSPIVRARAYVSADQQYELYVNGSIAAKGQAYSYPDTQYYETTDVTTRLRAGADNAVGIIYAWDGATKGHPAGIPGVIAQISVLHRDGVTQLITTDATWRVQAGAWLPGRQRDEEGDDVDYIENVEGFAQPLGWDSPGFDDRSWPRATVLGPAGTPPWTHLVSVRTRVVEQPVAPVSVTTLPSGAVVADFGQVIAAVPTVVFHHGVFGRVVVMRAGYLLDEPSPGQPVVGEAGQVSFLHATQHTDMSYTYIERGGGAESFRPFDYLGFRYFEIVNPGEKVSRQDIVAFSRHTAVPDENAASFSSSDPTVDAVFELGRHSALFTAQEQFIDTPTREKGPWLWDGFNESETAMAMFGEENLTRKSLHEFAQSQARYWPQQGAVNKIYPTGLGALDIDEFTEIYPEWVWQYWLQTGDRSFLTTVYPVLATLSGYVARAIAPATGLVTRLPATNVSYPYPVATRLNVLGVDVFRRTAEVAGVLARNSDEARWGHLADSLTAAINARLTRPDGTYVDGLATGGGQLATASQASNTCALVYGVVPPANQPAVAKLIAAGQMSSQPRTAGELLESLRLSGLDGAFIHLLTDTAIDGWANILSRGATFTWEVWNPQDSNGDSMSHGWASNVSLEIQRELLGVNLTGPGGSSFDVFPPASGLAWASGRVPTTRGAVVVDWHRPATPTGAFTLAVSVPANATATVRLPALGAGGVTEGGAPVARAPGVHSVTIGAGDVEVVIGAGTYAFRSAHVPPTAVAPAGPAAVVSRARGSSVAWMLVPAGVLVAVAGLLGAATRRRRAAPVTPPG